MTHRVDKNWGKPHSHCTLRYVCAYIIMKSSAQKTFWTSIVACLLICSQLVFRENAIYSQDITTLQCIEDTRWYLQDWNFRCKKGNVTHWVHLHGWEDWEVIYKGLSALTTQFSPPSGWRGSSWRWNFWYELEIGDTYDSHHNVYNKGGWILRPQDGLLLQFPLLSKYLKHTKLSRATLPNCQNFQLIVNISNWPGLPPPAVSKPSQLPLLPNLLSPRRTCWSSCWCCCSCCCCCCCWWGQWCWTSLLFTSREGGVPPYPSFVCYIFILKLTFDIFKAAGGGAVALPPIIEVSIHPS